MNEGVLIEKLRKGKPTAYKYLFSEYYQWLCNYIYNLSGNRSLSEDIVQEALISFWEKRERIIITTSLKSYLFKTCHNQFLQHLRTQKIKFDELDKIKWEALTEAAVEEETEFKLAKLNILIDQLPPRCKEIFIQSKIEKKKYKEIALDLGISVKTVENQMSKALHFLKTNATLFLL